jgi:hypothetical protein
VAGRAETSNEDAKVQVRRKRLRLSRPKQLVSWEKLEMRVQCPLLRPTDARRSVYERCRAHEGRSNEVARGKESLAIAQLSQTSPVLARSSPQRVLEVLIGRIAILRGSSRRKD